MNRTILTLAVAALCALPIGAQTLFRASLDGFQETPPIPGTLAGGWATVSLDTATSRITYEVRTFGLVGTAAHIHAGALGVPGGIEVPLSGGPTTWSGLSIPLTAGQIATMQSGPGPPCRNRTTGLERSWPRMRIHCSTPPISYSSNELMLRGESMAGVTPARERIR
jgi:hypothetical protein